MTVKVLVADDHRLMIEGVRAALADAEDIEVVGEAINGAQVLPLTHRLRPDLVLLDLSMPLMDGLACLAQLRQRFPEIKVVILSAYSDPERIQAALRAGASGYIVKGVDSRDLAATLRQMLEGNVYMTIGLPEPGKTAGADAAGLTEREVGILKLVAQGHSNGHVAQELFVTEQTVKFHLSNIYRKLDVSNRTEASRWAQLNGILPATRVPHTSAA